MENLDPYYGYKPIPNYVGYFVDTNGDVWSTKKSIGRVKGGKIGWRPVGLPKKMSLRQGWGGYKSIRLRNKNNTRSTFAHRLVAEVFISNPDNKPQVCHKNDIRNDNRVENLFWGTAQENSDDCVSKGRSTFGQKNGRAKVSKFQVQRIRVMREIGSTYEKIGSIFGIAKSSIYKICKGKNWQHII